MEPLPSICAVCRRTYEDRYCRTTRSDPDPDRPGVVWIRRVCDWCAGLRKPYPER